MINSKKLIYLAGPYSDNDPKVVAQRFKTFNKVSAHLISKKDVYVFSPISHSHPIVNTKAFDRENFWKYSFWMPFDTVILDVCDEMWILDLPGWEKSRGVAEEINHCNTNGKPIRMVTKRGKVYPYVV